MVQKISKEILNDLIRDIINSFTVTDKGTIQWTGNQSILYRRNLNIFYSIVLDDLEFIKKFKQKRYSFTPENTAFFGHELLDIFKKLKIENNASFDEFKKEFEKKIDEISNISSKKFTLIYPLNFKFAKKIDSEINGEKFEIISFEDFKLGFLDIEKVLGEAKSKNDISTQLKLSQLKSVCNEKFSFFAMSIYARNYFFAEEYTTEKLLGVLGLLIFVRHYRNTPFTMIGRIKKLSNLSLTKVLIFEEGKFVISADYNEQITAFEKIEELDIDNLLTSLDHYNKIDSDSIKGVLRDALNSYYEASTEQDLVYSFFKYWVCIELCLLKTKNVTEKEILNRLKSIILSEDKYLKLRVEKLYDIRNKFVHELKMQVSQFDRNLSKSISESLIEFLLYNSNKFSNKNELNLFYKFIQEDNSSLETDKKIIDLILEFRKSDKGDKHETKQ